MQIPRLDAEGQVGRFASSFRSLSTNKLETLLQIGRWIWRGGDFHTRGLRELVGREGEIQLTLRRWSKAKSGEGQVVLLSGEPGIGKSRLTAAAMERLANEPYARLRPQKALRRLLAPIFGRNFYLLISAVGRPPGRRGAKLFFLVCSAAMAAGVELPGRARRSRASRGAVVASLRRLLALIFGRNLYPFIWLSAARLAGAAVANGP